MSSQMPYKLSPALKLPLFVDAPRSRVPTAHEPDCWHVEWRAPDDSRLVLRPVCPADVGRSRAFMRDLSFGARYFRFGRGDFQFGESELRALCCPDPKQCADFIVLACTGADETEIAAARYCIAADGRQCEFAIVVADAWQHSGVGRRLMDVLIRHAGSRGLSNMNGEVLASNTRMLAFVERLGFEIEACPSGSPVRVVRKALAADAPKVG